MNIAWLVESAGQPFRFLGSPKGNTLSATRDKVVYHRIGPAYLQRRDTYAKEAQKIVIADLNEAAVLDRRRARGVGAEAIGCR
jgi:hypothetical protein